MAQFTIDIPDQLLPALVVEFGLVQGSTTAATPAEYFSASVVETVRQRAEIYKVGPYYVGPIDPQYNADGSPYGVTPVPAAEEQVIITLDEEPVPLETEAV